MAKLSFIAVMLLSIVTFACANPLGSVEFDQITLEIAEQEYTVEYAQSYEQRGQGLMFRTELCGDCGMFFKFDQEKFAGMWMKNTNIPLDVAFIDRNGVITDIKPLTPHDLSSVGSSKKVLYALEMNQGWFAEHKVSVGDQINVK